MTAFLARRASFEQVGSTNDVVREWLADGTPEVCLAVATEQTAGRGRAGRRWVAPPGAALLLSLGFRPTWLDPAETWRLGAVVSLAMATAAEAVAGLESGTVRLKWPNDLVLESERAGDAPTDASAAPTDASVAGGFRKVAGLLGETDGLGSDDPRAVVGLGINVDWEREAFPAELAATMTSLRAAAGAGRPIACDALLEAFLGRLGPAIEALRAGHFDASAWTDRQLTTGRMIRLEAPDAVETLRALGVDPATGALIVADPSAAAGRRQVVVGEITRVRLAEPIVAGV